MIDMAFYSLSDLIIGDNYFSGVLYVTALPSWVVYFLTAAIPIAVVLSSLVTALVIRKTTPAPVDEIDYELKRIESAAPVTTPMVIPEPESTPKVAVEEPGRGPIPINVHEVSTTIPPNLEEPVYVPTISTFEVTENPTDLFFHEGTIWVCLLYTSPSPRD